MNSSSFAVIVSRKMRRMRAWPVSNSSYYTYRGRKKSLNSEQVTELKRRVVAGEQKALIARNFGISRETLYQYLKTVD